jgi:VWFA-related protein
MAGAFALSLLAVSVQTSGQAPPAQTPQTPPQPPTFRGRIELTQIDVSVQDANRRPVRGLTIDDFELFEDGKPQRIEAFAEVNVPDAEEGAGWVRDVASDVRSNAAEDGRVLIFLLDEAMTQTFEADVITPAVKRIANTVIDRMGPNDVAAVIFTWDNKRQAQDFTTDRARLRAAIELFKPRQFLMSGYNWRQVSIGMTGSVLEYLADVPGRRKALILVSPTMAIRPPWPWVYPRPSIEDLHTLRAFEEAIRAGVTVYGISPTGLRALGEEGDAVSLTTGAPSGGRAARPRPLSAPPRSLAGETGGFIINTLTQFDEGVAQIFRETGSYYLLGYKAPTDFVQRADSPTKGYRSIEVRVKRPGLVARGRTAFIPPKPTKPPKQPASPLHNALAGVLPKADLPLRVSVAPFAVPGKSEAAIVMVLSVEQPAPTERTTERLDMQARAFGRRGEPRAQTSQSVNVTLPSGRANDVRFEVLTQLRLKPGFYELRLSARSSRLAKDGSVYANLDVPDFANDPLALSGIVVTATPRAAAAPVNAFASVIPVVPTAQRTFAPADRATAFLRVYQGGRKPVGPVSLTVRVIDRADVAALDQTTTLDPSRFNPARTADVHVDLPLSRLGPGSYLLRIDAALGEATVRRELRFSVR